MTEDQYNILFDAFIAREESPDETGAPKTLSKLYKDNLRHLGWFLLSIDEAKLEWADGELRKRRIE